MLGILAMIVFAVGFAGAVSLADIIPSYSPTVAHDAGSFVINFNVTNSGDEGTIALSSVTTLGKISSVSFSENNFMIAEGNTAPVTKTLIATVAFPKYQSGTLAGTIRALKFAYCNNI